MVKRNWIYSADTTQILRGFTTVEVVLAAALLAIVSLGIAGGLASVVSSSSETSHRIQAQYLADEAIEATLDLERHNFELLTDGDHGLVLSSNRWSFLGSLSTIDLFSRRVNIQTTHNDLSTGEITKKVTSTVTWGNPVKTATQSMYVTNWKSRVVNLATSWANPIEQSTLNLSGNDDAVKVLKYGTTAYVLRDGNPATIAAANIANPATPVYVSQVSLAVRGATDFVISSNGQYAYIATTDNSNEIVVVNLQTMSRVGSFNAAGNNDARSLAISGSILYLTRDFSKTSGQYEFAVLSLANPAAPVLYKATNPNSTLNTTAFNMYGIYVSGNYGYVATSDSAGELQTINISNPAAPTFVVPVLNLPGSISGNEVTGFGSYVLLSRNNGTFTVLSISTPSLPSIITALDAGGNVAGFAWDTDLKYLFLGTGDSSADFKVWDISNMASIPTTPLASLNLSSNANDILYDPTTNRVYVVTSSNSEELIIIQPQ